MLEHLDPVRLEFIKREANKLSAYFGAPVYLCGSRAKPDSHDPRDWDLRIPLQDKIFAERYNCCMHEPERTMSVWRNALSGVSYEKTGKQHPAIWAWAKDCVHHSRSATRSTCQLVDVQVQPESFFLRFDQSFPSNHRVRLDDGPWPEPKYEDYGLVDTRLLDAE